MLSRLVSIGREMLPSFDLVCKSAIRATIGLSIVGLAGYAPQPVAPWISFAGKFFVMLAAIGLLGHAEGIFASHVSAKLRLEAPRAAWVLAAPFLLIAALATVHAREPHEDEHGLG